MAFIPEESKFKEGEYVKAKNMPNSPIMVIQLVFTYKKDSKEIMYRCHWFNKVQSWNHSFFDEVLLERV